jgi:trehalose 6-phosphate phosphatase
MTTYLFSKKGVASLQEFVDLNTLFAFDLDGTLAPIVADPDRIRVDPLVTAQLERLIHHATVAIITGRSVSDAGRHLSITPQFLIGNHGAEGLPEKASTEKEFVSLCNDWGQQLERLIPRAVRSGIIIEHKGPTISVHYRNAVNRTKARAAVLAAIGELTPRPKRVAGKYVENILPEAAPDKGTAMLYLMHLSGCTRGLYVGDDVTDEDVFSIDDHHLFTILIGTERKTNAEYTLKRQGQITLLLRTINGCVAALPSKADIKR